MRIAIATVQVPFVRGGAEILVEDLRHALTARGHQAEVFAIPWKWYPPELVMDHMLAFRLLDLRECVTGPIDLLIGMKFPAYLIPHPNKILWIMHQHRAAYDLWEDQYGLIHSPRGTQIREMVVRADRKAIAESRRVFTIAQNVSNRLRRYLDADSAALYPPPRNAEKFYRGSPSEYLFFPSRVSATKRHFMVIDALALTRQPVQVRFAGSADTERYLEEMKRRAAENGVSSRIQWMGWVSEAELIRNYAGALGVLFPPQDEDYGYVTLEAMLSSKPVITCSDSGGALEFVVHGETGWIAEPSAEALAVCMDDAWSNPGRARRFGVAGRRHYESLSIDWNHALDSLLDDRCLDSGAP